MIDAVMYGDTPIAKIEYLCSAPPPKVFNKPNTPVLLNDCKAPALTPGTGI